MELHALQEQFAPFREYLGELQNRIANGEDPNALPGHREMFFHDESRIDYFAIPPEVANTPDEKYVGQLFSPDPEAEGVVTPLSEQVEEHAGTMAIAIGHTGLEQIVAYSSSDVLAVIAKDPEGDRLDHITPSNFEYVPDESYIQLFNTFRTMEELGLSVRDEHYMSLVLQDAHPEDPSYIPNFIVTRLCRNPDVTFIDHVREVGMDLAMSSWRGGRPVPSEAVHYYKVVDRCLGKEAGLEIIDGWLRRGYPIPSINYRDEPPR